MDKFCMGYASASDWRGAKMLLDEALLRPLWVQTFSGDASNDRFCIKSRSQRRPPGRHLATHPIRRRSLYGNAPFYVQRNWRIKTRGLLRPSPGYNHSTSTTPNQIAAARYLELVSQNQWLQHFHDQFRIAVLWYCLFCNLLFEPSREGFVRYLLPQRLPQGS